MIRGKIDHVVWVIANPSGKSRTSQSEGRDRKHVGEFLVKTEHTGDCFYDFELLQVDADGVAMTFDTGSCLCGYESALMHSGVTLTVKDYHRLLGGCSISLKKVMESLNKAAMVACNVYDQRLQEFEAWKKKLDHVDVKTDDGWTDFEGDES